MTQPRGLRRPNPEGSRDGEYESAMSLQDRDPYPRIDIPPTDDAQSGGRVRPTVLSALVGALAGSASLWT